MAEETETRIKHAKYYEGMGGEIDTKSNVLKIPFHDGTTRVYKKAIDFKAFYKAFHDFLGDKDFTDKWKAGRPAAPSEAVDKDYTRDGDMFETYYLYADRLSTKEFDVAWETKKDISANGVLYFKINMVSRVTTDKEVNGKNLQEGDWEMAVWASYENDYGKKLAEAPFAKKINFFNWASLGYDYIMKNHILRDIQECEKTLDEIWEFIDEQLS